jgi:DnaJ-class molecular chaperone
MARVHTHYDNLKIARNAPQEVIRAAYKALSQKYHPDRNPNSPDAQRIAQMINSAYEVLSDPAKRREHDDWIARAEAEAQETARPSSSFSADYMSSKTSENTRRRSTNYDVRHTYGRRSFRGPKIIQKALMALDQFSRRLFRRR